VTHDRELRIRPGIALAIAMGLLGAGGGIAYLMMSAHAHAPSTSTTTAPLGSPGSVAGTNTPAAPTGEVGGDRTAGDRLPDVVVPLADDLIARAGIKTAVVAAVQGASDIRLPGVVEANAYKQVAVTPLVSGRVTHVYVELGAHVKRNQPIAAIYSPELTEAQTKYVAARAMLDAHDRELQRTEKLVAIGAASRQELERAHAEHTGQVAELEAARSRLLLLGIPQTTVDALSAGKSVESTAIIVAPLDGVVTERLANVGLNVDSSTKLFSVVDLATVWVVADVYEKDLSRVSVGATVIITTSAYPGHQLQGHISYIDPQVSGATRTARIRVEVSNTQGELRLGMYATVLVQTAAAATAILIPRTAVQQVGDRQVAYLRSHESGTFIEREITTARRGEQVEVLSGLQPGDVIVVEGSFFVRAERERLGLRQPSSARSPTSGGGEHEPHHH
jgi:cobalt-zinc-cadmium efflux system membrane fusion protein